MISITRYFETKSSKLIEGAIREFQPFYSNEVFYFILEVRGDNQLILPDKKKFPETLIPERCQFIILGDFPYDYKFDAQVFYIQLAHLLGQDEKFAMLKPCFIATPLNKKSFSNLRKFLEGSKNVPQCQIEIEPHAAPVHWEAEESLNKTYGYKGLSFCDPKNPLSSSLPGQPTDFDIQKMKRVLLDPTIEFVSLKFSNSKYVTSLPSHLTAIDLSCCGLSKVPNLEEFNCLEWLNLGGNGITDIDYDRIPTSVKVLYLHKSNLRDIRSNIGSLKKLVSLSFYRTCVSSLRSNNVMVGLKHLNIGATRFNKTGMSQIPKIAPNLESLNISNLGLEALPEFIDFLPQLKKIDIRKNRLPESDLKYLLLRNYELLCDEVS